MNKFAAIAVLAASASAVELEQLKVYDATFDMLPDEKMMASMPQGEGRDHTDWSWHLEHLEEADKVARAAEDLRISRLGEAGAIAELELLRMKIIEGDEEHNRQCQLHREEEMNLYYQCTQNDINNYALHHFGGEVRSYPRWVKEYNVCIDHIHRAKTLHLDFFMENGDIEKRPCDPQSHDSTTYIGQVEDVVIVHPVISKYTLTEVRLTYASPPSSVETEIRMENRLTRSVDLVWMNFEGKPVMYQKNIKPGHSITQHTYVNHVWRIIDSETKQVYRYFEGIAMPNEDLILDFHIEAPVVVVEVDKTSITETPLNPKASCWDQAVPNWSGIWVEIWGGPQEAADILSGAAKVDPLKHTQRCYTITATGEQKADLLESWDGGSSRDYDLTLREDNRDFEGGCMIHTHLKGTQYTQWVSSVSGDISMSDQIIEKWHQQQTDGSENYLSTHHEIRIGSCKSDGKITVEKTFTPGIKF